MDSNILITFMCDIYCVGLIASVELLQVTHEFLLWLLDFQPGDHLRELVDLIFRGRLCFGLIGTRHLFVFDFFDGAALV